MSTSASEMAIRNRAIDELSQETVALLSKPSTFADRPARVELIETHISWVFLTDHYVYKLKKPLQFDFLNYATPELRRTACEEEIRLNRRLAPHVYLEVLPVTIGSRKRLCLGGSGPAVDWVVKMRRLNSERRLDLLVQKQGLPVFQVDQLAQTLNSLVAKEPASRVSWVPAFPYLPDSS